MRIIKSVTLFVFSLVTLTIHAQSNIYLLGNLDGDKLPQRLEQLSTTIVSEQKGKPFHLILLGDLKPTQPEKEAILLSFIDETKKIGGQIIAISGDKDWDNAGYYGLDSLTNFEKRIEKKLNSKLIVPEKGCPGPYVKDIDENIRIIAISSQWWLHQYRKREATDSKCDNILPLEIIGEIDDAIESAGNKRVILIAHHPLVSGGVYGGNSNLMGQFFPFSHNDPDNKTFLPFFGTFYHCYRQNVGSNQDFSSLAYTEYIKSINTILLKYQDVIVASAHEFDLQLLKINSNYQIISGGFLKNAQVSAIENTLFKSNKPGFVKLEFFDDGVAFGKFFLLNNKTNLFETEKSFTLNNEDHRFIFTNDLKAKESQKYIGINDSIIAGDYGANKFKQLFFGNLYRTSWTTPISVPTLDLSSTKGGLTPTTKGGGLQTISLKFKAKNGVEYAFRSIDKTPAKAIPAEFRIDLIKDVAQDMTATQHPYGTLIVDELLNATDILHTTSKLYIMPDTPELGIYRSQFAGMFGLLEEKPTEFDDASKSFAQADKIKSSLSVFQKLYDNPKNKVDTFAFAKARIFDVFIGDWDRHEDNWKWAGYKKEGETIYIPIPKDRDHAFSQMDGLFYYLADREWAIPFRENFNNKFTGLKSLTIKGGHMDRYLLTGLKREDWLKVSTELNNELTEEVIDNAIQNLPKELQNESGKEIGDKLKARKPKLNNAIEKYYLLLAKEVDVVGTNKKEFFDVKRNENGSVTVKMTDKNDTNKLFFNRTFYPNETKEIRLFGLAKQDSFYVHGTSNKSILVRIVGGLDTDVVVDESNAKFGGKKTIIYDYPEGITAQKGKETRIITSERSTYNEYDREAFKYNTYLPIPMIVSNPDDGFGGGFTLHLKRFGFGHHDYKAIHTLKAFATTEGSTLFSLATERNIERTKLYVTGNVEYGNFFPFYRFYGAGNKTELVDSIADAGLYKARYSGAIFNVGTTYRFFNRSSFSVNAIAELLENSNSDESFFDVVPSPELQPRTGGGGEVKLLIDFRDSPTFTTKGILVAASHKSIFTDDLAFGKTSFELGYYTTSRVLIPITLGIKIGTERTYGDEIPFYHLANLGQSYHLRGYRQNRFSGTGTNYVNTDLRFHLGKFNNSFLPMFYGVNLFSDIGQVVSNKSFTDELWHHGYGGGIYLTPINKDFVTLQINIEHSKEENALVKIGLGVLF